MIPTTIRCYAELSKLETFEERFHYLALGGTVGRSTFGFDRWINQEFYRSQEWKEARRHAIIRDQGCDLGIPGYAINGALLVHHMNPMTAEDVIHGEEWLINPEFLIVTTHDTHNAIHFGDAALLRPVKFVERRPGDTKLW